MLWRITIIAFSILITAGCHYEPEEHYKGPTSIGQYRLDSGDQVRVIVFEQTELSQNYTVDSSGKIAIPLAGQVRARGRTTTQLKYAIQSMLGREYVKNPKVSVQVVAYRPFFILGEVENAGQYPYVSNLTVESAVALAGGYSERANQRKIRITRRARGGLVSKNVAPNYLVRPGDTVVVKERWF